MIIFIFYKIHNDSKIYSRYSLSFLTFPNQILSSILLFSHTTTKQSQIAFHLYKRKRDLRIEKHPNSVSFLVSLFAKKLYTAQIFF